MTPKSVTINMPYQSNLSVNHYLGRRKGGGYYVKKDVKDWQEMLGWFIKGEHIEEWGLPLTVKCDCCFKNLRSACDTSNLSKVILDAIEETTGVNDKFYRWRDGSVLIDKTQEPRLTITITSE